MSSQYDEHFSLNRINAINSFKDAERYLREVGMSRHDALRYISSTKAVLARENRKEASLLMDALKI